MNSPLTAAVSRTPKSCMRHRRKRTVCCPGRNRAGGSALDGLNAALVSVEHAAALDERLLPVAEALRGAVSYAEDAAHELRVYQEAIEFNPERLEEIDARLDQLRSLKRKYGETVEEIIGYGEELMAKLDRLENAEAREDELTAAISKGETALKSTSERLTKVRRKGSVRVHAWHPT